MSTSGLERVVLAISAYRSDEEVIDLLRLSLAPGAPKYGAIIVVDSLGSGRIEVEIADNGWPVDYVNVDTNLGSAGNLDRRLSLAAETGLDWCLALNHDGEADPAKALNLLRHGEESERVGAVYPTMRMTSAGGKLDRPRRGFTTFGLLTQSERQEATTEVTWSSSNGALYRLDAIRGGVHPWPQLWMGYEDLAIGWEFHRRGWRQLLCNDVIVDDNYEFRRITLLGKAIHIADKPSWYSYYQLRNLALIARGTAGEAVGWAAITRRGIADFFLLLFRPQKVLRARLLVRGLWDGLRGVSGMNAVNRR